MTPLNGATISLKNGAATSKTKVDEHFETPVPAGKVTMVVSFVGYQSQDMIVGPSESSISVSLKPSGDMSEVVVIGYGTKKKVDLTGAISTISAKEIESRPIRNTHQALQVFRPPNLGHF